MEKSVLLQEFVVDKETRNYVRQVHGVVFSTVRPDPLKHKPSLVAISTEVVTEILDLKTTSVSESPSFIEFVAGNYILPNSVLLSHRYGGHQVRFLKLHGVNYNNLAVGVWDKLNNILS